jgi:hypothetical protein
VWSEAEHAAAERFLLLAAAHHLIAIVIGALFWVRRRDMERAVAIYFALAFASTAVALATVPSGRITAAVAALLALLWCREVVHPRNVLSLRRTPRLRLVIMGILGVYALAYPAYPVPEPIFVFAPLGVTLQPTVLLALALLNAAAPRTDRLLHWALVVVGLLLASVGAFSEGWAHAPLAVAAVYGVPLLLGRFAVRDEGHETDATSVRAVHDRMHKRRVLLSRPRRSSVRRLDIRKRRK